MTKTQVFSVPIEEVLQVENKWSFLPITPTYDQYVQRWVVMTDGEGFHLITRSDMKELIHDTKSIDLHDKWKKRVFF
jgi:hypothetical protein